ncbi:MAG: alpha-amylase family glycosyl hydrolase, partial [Gemmatimonadaceae bacterium]
MTRRRAARAALVLVAIFAGSRALAQSAVASAIQPVADWVQGATCYEVFVRSFRDSDGDGIGDLKGLIGALDYINDGNPRSTRSLGARCLWLMPIMESPGYHGYDVSDYYRVARVYGTNDDFKRLVAASHRRGIKVLVDMVINHASSEYPPFQSALRDSASPYRSWFRFAPTRGPDNRWGNNNWHRSPVRDEYYYGFFWRGMPDLNYESPDALNEMKQVASFWLNEMGVDGFRLDAVRYLVEDGATVDDTPGTHAVLREYGAHVRQAKPGAFTIGEVFDSTGTLLTYYPDQLDAYFAFEVGVSLIAGVRRG